MSAPTQPVDVSDAPADERDAAPDVRLLTEYLATRNAKCPLCGYNLRGLTSPRCPECGRRLRLSIGLTEPYLGAWVLLAAATCAAGGTGVFFTLMVVTNGWPTAAGSEMDLFFLNAALLYFIFSIPVAAAVVIARRPLMRLKTDLQWTIAWFFVAATCGAMLVFAGVVS